MHCGEIPNHNLYHDIATFHPNQLSFITLMNDVEVYAFLHMTDIQKDSSDEISAHCKSSSYT